jgi:sugar phosphate isomerase/epimerase
MSIFPIVSKECLFDRGPFRVGATSYIVPADIKTNVTKLLGRVKDIELLFFESRAEADLPTAEEIARFRGFRASHGMSYTVHLPIDIALGHPDDREAARGVAACRNIVRLTAPLDPMAYILHLDPAGVDLTDAWCVSRWRDRIGTSIGEILKETISPRMLAIENLDYPFSIVAPIITQFNLSVCVDIGHLSLLGVSPIHHIEQYLDRVSVIHLHGVDGERDHRALDTRQRGLVKEILSLLRGHIGGPYVLTLEVFDENDLNASLKVMEASI